MKSQVITFFYSHLSRHWSAYFEPGFSAESLELLRMIRDFLSEEKVIPESFDLDGWVDTSFWEQALNELK